MSMTQRAMSTRSLERISTVLGIVSAVCVGLAAYAVSQRGVVEVSYCPAPDGDAWVWCHVETSALTLSMPGGTLGPSGAVLVSPSLAVWSSATNVTTPITAAERVVSVASGARGADGTILISAYVEDDGAVRTRSGDASTASSTRLAFGRIAPQTRELLEVPAPPTPGADVLALANGAFAVVSSDYDGHATGSVLQGGVWRALPSTPRFGIHHFWVTSDGTLVGRGVRPYLAGGWIATIAVALTVLIAALWAIRRTALVLRQRVLDEVEAPMASESGAGAYRGAARGAAIVLLTVLVLFVLGMLLLLWLL
jgi:hypothetical protein